MAMLSNKHGQSVQRIFYSSCDGGLNLSVPNESMALNELKEALNMEFSPLTGSIRVRGGLVYSGHFDYIVDNIVPVHGRQGFLARYKNTREVVFFRWNNIWPVSGTLTGDEDVSIVAWEDYYLVASGGKLQKFISDVPPYLTTISEAPDNCRYVFVRNGRVGVVSGEDTIQFSGVGDCTIWENDPDDESTGQFIEIGYKDGMNINAIVPLSRDLIIFKSPEKEPDKGTIWRLTGDFPEWTLLEVAHNTGTFSQRSVKVVGNDIFYLTVSGLATLGTVTQYGEVKTSWLDRKVSRALTPLINENAQLWDIPVKQQLWILPSETEEQIWVFDYTRGIWTQFEFPYIPSCVIGADNKVFVFIGQSLYELNDGYLQDELYGEDKVKIKARMRLGTLLKGRQILIKGVFASFGIMPECTADLKLGKFVMPFESNAGVDYIYGNPDDLSSNYYQEAYADDDPLFPEGGVMTSRRRCIVRDWAITPEIEFSGGCSSLSTMGLETVEV